MRNVAALILKYGHNCLSPFSRSNAEIVNYAVDDRERGAEHDHRACDFEHVRAYARHIALAAAFDGDGADRVRKSRDRDKRARAGEFRQHVEPADAGQQAGQKDQRDRRQRRRDTLLRAETGVQVGERLSQRADQTADEKGFDRIEQTTALLLRSET